MMMNAMYWHNLIEVVLELAGISACVIAFLAVVITGLIYYTEGPGYSAALDVINSQYLNDTGTGFDYSKNNLPVTMSGAPRARINTPAYRNGDKEYDKRKGIIMPPEPEEIEVDADDMPDDPENEPDVVEWDTVDRGAIAAKFPQRKVLAPKNKVW